MDITEEELHLLQLEAEAFELENNVLPPEITEEEEWVENDPEDEEDDFVDFAELEEEAEEEVQEIPPLVESVGTIEIYVDFWERDKHNKLIWTIEHIFPEGNNIPECWVDMIADGDKSKAKKIQNESVHKLGNLTLTGYNQYLSNFDFLKKRNRKE